MKKKYSWIRTLYLIGIFALILGMLDPLEGSVVVTGGSILLAISTFLMHDRYRWIFLAGSILILFGVVFMFYLSSLGGFGGKSGLSWWFGLFVIPYPIGWLLNVVVLIVRGIKGKQTQKSPIDKENHLDDVKPPDSYREPE